MTDIFLAGAVWLNSSQICARFSISQVTLWSWVKRGRFPEPAKINGRNYWRLDELAAFEAGLRPRAA